MMTLAGVIWKASWWRCHLSWIEMCSIQTEAGWRRSCPLIPVSTNRRLMALGVLILVLTWDPPTPGKAESPCLAGEEHRQRGRRERGVQEGEDQGEKAGHWSKGRGGVQLWPKLELQSHLQMGWLGSGLLLLGLSFSHLQGGT